MNAPGLDEMTRKAKDSKEHEDTGGGNIRPAQERVLPTYPSDR